MCCFFVQLSAIQHNLQMKEKEYEAKLQTLEDGQRERMNELREMLTAQQRMTVKCVNITTRCYLFGFFVFDLNQNLILNILQINAEDHLNWSWSCVVWSETSLMHFLEEVLYKCSLMIRMSYRNVNIRRYLKFPLLQSFIFQMERRVQCHYTENGVESYAVTKWLKSREETSWRTD